MMARASIVVIAALGTGMWAGAPAAADDPDIATSQPCALCAWPYGWRGAVEAGPGWVSDSEPHFADYRGLSDAGPWLSLNGQVRYLDAEGRSLGIWWREPTLDARNLRLRGGVQGRWMAQFDWRDIPHITGIDARTPFLGVGSGNLTLPTDWVRSDRTTGLSALNGNLQPVDLGLQRRQLDFVFDARLGSDWRWNAEASHIRREGLRAFGAGSLTLNTSHIPAPVDHTTDLVSLGIEYLGDTGSLQARIGGSWFDNGTDSLTWDNPFSSLVGALRLRAALEPSNRAWSAQLGGSWRPTSDLRLSGRAGVGAATQDEAFLPYATLEDFEVQPLPRPRLGGRVEALSMNASGSLDLKLSRGWDLGARARLDDRDNHTPVEAWKPVITDFYQREPTLNRPYSFRREQYELQARFRAPSGWRFVTGVRHRSIERSLQSVAETTENGLWAQLGVRPASRLGMALKLEASDRDATDYQPLVDPGLPTNPLMRKYNLADRSRRQARLDLDWSVSPNVSLNVGARWSNDDYGHSPLGLQTSRDGGIELGLQAALGDDHGLYGWVGAERIEAAIDSQQDFVQNWRSRTDDRFLSWGLGGHARIGDAWTLRLDGYGMRSTGRIVTDGQGFPELETDLRHLGLWVEFDDGKSWAWKLSAAHERYESVDWQRDDIAPDGIPAVLSFGLASPDGSVTVLRALGSYRF